MKMNINLKRIMRNRIMDLKSGIEEQDEVIKSLIDYVYTLEEELNQAKHYINVLKGELSVFYNLHD